MEQHFLWVSTLATFQKPEKQALSNVPPYLPAFIPSYPTHLMTLSRSDKKINACWPANLHYLLPNQ